MAKVVKNNLGFLGVDFQFRLISSFINEPKFFKDLESIIEPSMFTDPYLRTVVGVMKEYYANRNGLVPSYSMLTYKLNERAVTEEDMQYYQETIDRLKNETTEGIDEIQDMAEKFFKQQEWIRVSNEIKRIAGDGGNLGSYEECEKLMMGAISIGRRDLDESHPMDNVDEDLSNESVEFIPTGISMLDKQMGGGIEKGKIGVIIGSSGFGKTSMTTCMAANAAVAGYKVLQIVFEDTHRDLHRKYFAKISQVEACDINSDPSVTEYVREALNNSPDTEAIKNNICIVRLESGEKTATEIGHIIKKKINEGFKPDMVIVDYFECIAPEKGTGSESINVREAKTMRKFESMAAEINVAMWIPVQGNRDSLSAELVTMDKSGGAIQKIQIAHYVISITRTPDDISHMKATISLLKQRGGKAGIVLNGVKFNNGTCTIECDEVVNFDSALTYNEYAAQEEADIEQRMIQKARREMINKKG